MAARKRTTSVKQGEQIAALSAQLTAHTEEDSRRFLEMNGKLDDIGADVKSLLVSRATGAGFWKAVLLVATGAGSIAGLVVAVVALWK